MDKFFTIDNDLAYQQWKKTLHKIYRTLILKSTFSPFHKGMLTNRLEQLFIEDPWENNWKVINPKYPCAYHNFGHMIDVYRIVAFKVGFGFEEQLAALYHDFGYTPGKSEEENIKAAQDQVAADLGYIGFPNSLITQILEYIQATGKHFEGENYNLPIVQADLSILNAPLEIYREYSKAIRKEYPLVIDQDYSKERLSILGKLYGKSLRYGVVPREGCFGVKEEINLLKAKVPKEESSFVLYGGSFDPFHRGHLEVVKRAVEKGMFVVVAVLQNPDKKSFLTLAQREGITLLTLAKAGLSGSTRVTGRYTSIVGALASEGCSKFLRGIRKDDPSSVNEEKTRAALLKSETGIETVLIPTSGLLSSYSSSSIKELIKTGHPAYGIPSFVRSILYRRHTSKEITLVVGGIATGKTTFCKDYSRFHTIDLDAVAKKYLYANPAFKESPEKILRYFRSPQKYFGYMNRVRPIIMAGVIQEINTLPGSTPIIIQCNKLGLFWKELLRLCNYNIIYLEDIPQEVAEARVAGRGSSKETLLAVLNLEKLAPTYEEISSFVEKRVRQAASLGLMVPEDTFETQLISRRP